MELTDLLGSYKEDFIKLFKMAKNDLPNEEWIELLEKISDNVEDKLFTAKTKTE